ncbi:HAMP domain-containing sensor histidine kinase [Fulvivirgaceae bacterium BMA12]|uniref:histidine kinase n=1 Tax=Agaribacillus aureus TaxID=3051825 RepID=A0ABT8L7W4_9BACT|nr:HAMP domain-containing sensor histidine kinase [Fulvivirgaceae bacterium BMA12]
MVTPIVGISLYFLYFNQTHIAIADIFFLVLAFTLLGIIFNVWLLNQLSYPITLAQRELTKYNTTNEIPDLPTHFRDEVGLILRDIKKRAKSTSRLITEKNDFTAMLSHDLRSPMVSIIGLLKLIREEPESAQAKYFCNKAEEFGYHQLKLMESVLSLLNEESQNRKTPKKVSINLSKFLAQSLSQFELTLKNKQLEISQNVPPHLEVKVEPYSFSQVITNLLHNAIKFSKKGDNIFVNASNGGDTVKISVRDQGIGFSLDNTAVLFERFTPERKRGTQGEPTNGLGLYLTKKIVEKHDGSIHAESPGYNKGATFKIQIPSDN